MNERSYYQSREAFPFLLAMTGAAIILLVTLLLPLGFDNDLYESMAWTLYAYHGLPYIASWDHNFPGIVFIHWASIVLFGASDFGFRLFDYLVHIAMAAVFYRFLRHWLSPRASAFGVLLYALYYASGQWGLAGQRDTYAGFLLLGATSLYISRSRGVAEHVRMRLFSMGMLCGAAFLMRPTYILFAISFLLLLWMDEKRFGPVVLYLAGSIVPILAFVIPYLFHPNGLIQLWDTLIRFNLGVYASVHIPINLWSGGRPAIYILAVVGLFFEVRNKQSAFRRHDEWMFLLLSASALLSPIWMGKYFPYHFEPFMLIAIGFAARGFEGATNAIHWRRAVEGVGIAVLASFAYLYYPHHLLRYYWEEYRRTDTPLEATYERVLSDSLFGLAAEQNVVEYVHARVKPWEPVEYVSIFPGMRWRLARPAATQFTSIVPLVAYQHRVPAFGAEWRKEFLDTFVHHPPRLLVVSLSQQWWPFVGKTNDSAIASIPGFDSLLSAMYLPDTIIRGYKIYRKRQ